MYPELPLNEITVTLIERYTKEHLGFEFDCPISRNQINQNNALKKLLSFVRTGVVPDKIEPTSNPKTTAFKTALSNYTIKLRERGLKESSIHTNIVPVKMLLSSFEKHNVTFDTMDPSMIQRFTNETWKGQSKSGCAQKIRMFLEFAFENKLITFSAYRVFPVIKTVSPKLLCAFKKDEVIAMIEEMKKDINKPHGLRNLLAMLLLIRVGLRIGDLVSLKYSDIDFEQKYIKKTMNKTGKLLNVPLADDVIKGLRDYANFLGLGEAHLCSDHFIFFKDVVESEEHIKERVIAYVIRHYALKIGLDPKTRHLGPHALRHLFGTALLETGKSYEIVKELFGHSDTITTQIYAQTDYDHLALLTLEPEYDTL
jgi:site-specific recombinase XerD